MCYRCSICKTIVPHGQALLKHIIWRFVPRLFSEKKRREIQEELPVCGGCHHELQSRSLGEVIRRNYRPRIRGIADGVPLPEYVSMEAPQVRKVSIGEPSPLLPFSSGEARQGFDGQRRPRKRRRKRGRRNEIDGSGTPL